jgi:hypothetical protein
VGSKLAEALIVFVVSIPVAIVAPYLTIRLVASAQNACLDVEAGQGFYLMVTWFGHITGSLLRISRLA